MYYDQRGQNLNFKLFSLRVATTVMFLAEEPWSMNALQYILVELRNTQHTISHAYYKIRYKGVHLSLAGFFFLQRAKGGRGIFPPLTAVFPLKMLILD